MSPGPVGNASDTRARCVNGTVQKLSENNHSLFSAIAAVKWIRGELIGRGTYGRVYLALSMAKGKSQLVAVKQVDSPQVIRDESDQCQATFVHSVERVSKLLVDLNHRHIVQYLGFEECFVDYSRVMNM
jgi:mitogen-activated protein kinase kinase kinase